MITRKIIRFFVFFTFSTSLLCCKPEEIILHFDVAGSVTDVSNNEAITDASLILTPSNDTVLTGQDGTFLFKNLIPGNYELEASKKGYNRDSKSISASPDSTYNIDFRLKSAPVTNFSPTFLDFGFDSTSLELVVSNSGRGKLTYLFRPSQEWISVHPLSGEVSEEADTIVVTINKSGLPEKTIKERLQMVSLLGGDIQVDTIPIYLDGIMDTIANYYYKTVRIGTQIWMAENVNTGEMIQSAQNQSDNNSIEKYCYNNNPEYCKIYGGLYTWDEMMQYKPEDRGEIGTTQGICPVGWHLPIFYEWDLLVKYLGGEPVAGGKLKEEGLAHWDPPNEGATNESGFSALPGGSFNTQGFYFEERGREAAWWSSDGDYFPLMFDSKQVFYYNIITSNHANSVRCVKNP